MNPSPAPTTSAPTGPYLAGVHLIQEIKVVADVARQWFGKVPMAVASNGIRKNVEATLISTRLRPLFYTIVTADYVEHVNPAPDVYLEAARRMRVQPDRVIVFEDSNEGLEAARRAGMRAYDIREVWSPMRQSHGLKHSFARYSMISGLVHVCGPMNFRHQHSFGRSHTSQG